MNEIVDVITFLEWLNEKDPSIMEYIPRNEKPKWMISK